MLTSDWWIALGANKVITGSAPVRNCALHSRSGAVGFRVGWLAALLLLSTLVFSCGSAQAASAPNRLLALQQDQSLTLTTTKAILVSLPRDASSVLVADPAVADIVVRTPRLAYLIGTKPGETNAFFLDAAGNRILTLDIRVERDLGALQEALDNLLPEGNLQARPLNADIVLSGEVGSSDLAESAQRIARRFVTEDAGVVNLIRITRPEQVLIQVRVTEMRRSIAKKLGVSLAGIDGNVNFRTGFQGLAGLFNDRFGVIDAVGSNILGLNTLSVVLEALEQEGLVKTLAEPNLTAMSGETANFLAGGEFPVPVGRDDNGQITLEFKPFGVGLQFSPVVLANGRINLKIMTEVSALSNEGAFVLADIRVPGLTVRRAETTVEIPSGGSLVLGGLLRNDAANQRRGLPGLVDLPVLGALFRSTEFQREETELVVIAVPYIVNPTRPAALSEPTDGFAPGSDIDRFLLGALARRYPAAGNLQTTSGSIGYIVE